MSNSAVEASPGLRRWLRSRAVSLALSTGDSGTIITLGAGEAGLTVFDATCDSPGALLHTVRGLHVAGRERLWRFDDALAEGELYQGTGRLFLPSQCRPTGAIGIQDLAVEESGKLLAAVARFNCIARMNSRGDLKPIWRPSFVDAAVREDRCHLTGFCLQDDGLAYVTLAAASNEKDGWRKHMREGGQVIDAASHQVVADRLTLPHAPRLYRNKLWLLESGTGWFGWVDLEKRRFERLMQLPGFPRALRFIGDHALITTSRHRTDPANGVPGVHWVNVKTGKIDHTLRFTSSINEVVDIALVPGEVVPRLAGLSVAESGPTDSRQLAS
jgi:uncharacterized protein (TIGR03032 family)